MKTFVKIYFLVPEKGSTKERFLGVFQIFSG